MFLAFHISAFLSRKQHPQAFLLGKKYSKLKLQLFLGVIREEVFAQIINLNLFDALISNLLTL